MGSVDSQKPERFYGLLHGNLVGGRKSITKMKTEVISFHDAM